MSTEDNNWQESFSVRMQNIDNQSKKKRRMSVEDMEWLDLYSVDIESIDDQHKEIVSLINVLHDAMRSQTVDNRLLTDLVDQLSNYTQYHFAYEEMFFLKYKYAGGETHKKLHRDFIHKINSFKKDLSVELSYEISSFLKTWLVDHIIGTDKKYVKFLKAHGVT